VVSALGIAATAYSLSRFSPEISWTYAATWLVALLAARHPMRLLRDNNGIHASAATAVLFFCLFRFGTWSTVPLAAVTMLVVTASVAASDRLWAVRAVFNVSTSVLGILSASAARQVLHLWLGDDALAAGIVGAVLAYVMVNSLLVAGVMVLLKGVPLRYVKDTCLLTAPSQFVGEIACAFFAVTVDEPRDLVACAILFIPVYLTHRNLSDHVTRLRRHISDLETARRDAGTDALTGLPNRRSLMERIGEEIVRTDRERAELSLLMIDLDGFKQLNDRFGHAVGDRALTVAAACMRESVRLYDGVFRLAGDEFVVLLPGCDAGVAESKRIELQERLSAVCIDTPEGTRCLGGSVGAAVFPADGRTADELLDRADERMYADKQRRKHAA
jgi:diguanylate cyclase (GGDEF)-like protein